MGIMSRRRIKDAKKKVGAKKEAPMKELEKIIEDKKEQKKKGK